jgi:hypothetical protein
MGKYNYSKRFKYRAAVILVLVAMLMMFFSTCTATEPQQPTPPKTNVSTMMVALSLYQLVERADLILTGTVTGLETKGETGSKNIYTNAIISVDQVIKGEPKAAAIIVKVPGGTVDGSTKTVEDTPSFLQNEKVLLFLKSNADNTMAVIGNLQGKGVIEEGKIRSVVISINGLSLAELCTRIEALEK